MLLHVDRPIGDPIWQNEFKVSTHIFGVKYATELCDIQF